MSRLLNGTCLLSISAVLGAPGQQGGSVINYVLNDPELSQKYKLRAITRDVNSEKAQQLEGKLTSSETALTGVYTIFAMTTPSVSLDGFEVEYKGGKTINDVAIEKEIFGGMYTEVTPINAKAKVEQYCAFYSPGTFVENLQSQTYLAPRRVPDGAWVMIRHVSPKTQLPLIDVVGDTGKLTGAILVEPGKHEGKTFYAATALDSVDEVAAIISQATGQTVVYKQIIVEDLRKSFIYQEEFGYFGPDFKELVDCAAEDARAKLSTVEEYSKVHPIWFE
ncbi:hypothetical protein F5X99DRAFT_422864 [Biscogniauxia marginata]|nr:hypothetical protein F5X99DRAFT_422864 [Biscogniauxia marginata]